MKYIKLFENFDGGSDNIEEQRGYEDMNQQDMDW